MEIKTIFNVKGVCTIIKPGNTFQKVAENSIGETVKAVPVFVCGKMIFYLSGKIHKQF